MQYRSPKPAFLILMAVLLAAFGAILKPFFIPAFVAFLLVIICEPIYQLFLKILRKKYIAAFAATLIVSLCVLTPLTIVTIIIIKNASYVTAYVSAQLEGGQIAQALDSVNAWVGAKMSEASTIIPADFNIRAMLVEAVKSASLVIYEYSPKVLTATASIVGGIFVMLIFMFALFAEGDRIYYTFTSILPLAEEHKKILARDIKFVISGTFLGMLATSIAQGILIGIGFWISGISNPLVWGLVAIGVTLIPVVGGPLMYIPASIALFISGEKWYALFILLFGIFVVSMIDNVIKPLVMRGKVNVHPLLLALALIGGGLWLGPIGIIVGPLVVVLMLAMIKIYQREFI